MDATLELYAEKHARQCCASVTSSCHCLRPDHIPALPSGGKYELVLDGAEHSAFGDRALPADKDRRNPNHHRAILAISTAFWDAWLKDEHAARAWLDGSGPRSILEAADRWQRK